MIVMAGMNISIITYITSMTSITSITEIRTCINKGITKK